MLPCCDPLFSLFTLVAEPPRWLVEPGQSRHSLLCEVWLGADGVNAVVETYGVFYVW